MADVTPDALLALAQTAGLTIPDGDVEQLTMRFNAQLEALSVLDDHPLDGVPPTPALHHPLTLPDHDRGTAPALATDTDAPLAYKPITELAHLIRTKQISPVDLTDHYLQRIGEHDGVLKSYITVTSDIARAEAKEAERKIAAGEAVGPLHGIPLGYKDEFYTKGVLTTCGSIILSEFVPDYDAAAVERLHDAGATMLGKLNMTEWATPLTLEFSYGQPVNPWNIEHDAGGSSTGSGSATAAGLCAGALGEDTGGSIRRPAAYNSCVGLRPSWGRVSLYGMIPGVWYQDTAGPLGRTVADCALLMNVLAGYDPRDPYSANLPVPDYTAVLDGDVRGMRIGVLREGQEADFLNPEVKAAVADAAARFERMGATVGEASIPLLPISGMINGALGSGRIAQQWNWLRDRPQDYDDSVRLYSLLPALLPSSLYQRAMQMRAEMRRQTIEAMSGFDVIISAYAGDGPPRIDDTKKSPRSKEHALDQLRRFNFGSPATFSAMPGMSVPCGFTSSGLPIGMHIMGDRFDEESVFRAAHAYEQDTLWHTMHPPVGSQ